MTDEANAIEKSAWLPAISILVLSFTFTQLPLVQIFPKVVNGSKLSAL